jgi:hypothetical protein
VSKIVEIAGRPYAVGLWWQIRSGGSAGKKLMLKSARETAAQFADEAYTHAALRAEQYGLASHEGEAWPPKTVSLAAALRPVGQDAFLGVFCLGEAEPFWWLCGILRGLVVADGDEIFGSKEEALAAAGSLRLMLESVGLTEIFLETPDESQKYLSPLLGVETPLVNLFQKERPWPLLIGAAAALLIIAGAAFSWIYGAYQELEEGRQRERQLAEKEAQKQDVLANPHKYFRTEWLTAPSVTASGGQCAAAVLGLPVSSNAWRFSEAVCRPGEALTVYWAHQKGASFVKLPKGAALISPQQAEADGALPPLGSRKTQPALTLLSRNQATAALYEITQNLAGQMTLNWEPPEQYLLDEATALSAPWQRGRFELAKAPAAALFGADLFEALGRHPGTVLTSLARNNNDLIIKGYIYALTGTKN